MFSPNDNSTYGRRERDNWLEMGVVCPMGCNDWSWDRTSVAFGSSIPSERKCFRSLENEPSDNRVLTMTKVLVSPILLRSSSVMSRRGLFLSTLVLVDLLGARDEYEEISSH